MMEIHFELDKETYINMPLPVQLSDLLLGMNAPVYFVHKKIVRYTLQNSFEDIWGAMIDFSALLKSALSNELNLPHEWNNIGYLFNQYLQDNLPDKYMKRDKYNSWIGMHYVVWAPAKAPSSLLYNHDGQIIFQIIPLYSHFLHKIPYKIFINNYHPYITRIIPRQVAQEWLEKTNYVMNIMLESRNKKSTIYEK